MKNLKNNKGFTLVELMIVVVIMGILVAVAVPVYGAVTKNSEKKTCFTNAEIIEKAGSQFMIITGAPDINAIFKNGGDSAVIHNQAEAEELLDERYLNCFNNHQFPVCPAGGAFTLSVDESNSGKAIKVICSEHGAR